MAPTTAISAQVNGEMKVPHKDSTQVNQIKTGSGLPDTAPGSVLGSANVSSRIAMADSAEQAEKVSNIVAPETFKSLVGDVYADFNELSIAFAKILHSLNNKPTGGDKVDLSWIYQRLDASDQRLNTGDHNRSARNHNRAIDNRTNDKLAGLRNVFTGNEVYDIPASIAELETIVGTDPLKAFHILAALGVELEHLHYPFFTYLRRFQLQGNDLSESLIPTVYFNLVKAEARKGRNYAARLLERVGDANDDDDDTPEPGEQTEIGSGDNAVDGPDFVEGYVTTVEGFDALVRELAWNIKRSKRRLQILINKAANGSPEEQDLKKEKEDLDGLAIFASTSDVEGKRLLQRQLRIAVGLPPVPINIDVHYL